MLHRRSFESLPLYEDSLVVLTPESLILKRYYFPTLKPKLLSLADIQRIEVVPANLWTGRWRIWGTGTLFTWYPLDFGRPKRDRVFRLTQRNKSIRIGFTVENSGSFIGAIGLLKVPLSPKPE
jgi:hypothetical protein